MTAAQLRLATQSGSPPAPLRPISHVSVMHAAPAGGARALAAGGRAGDDVAGAVSGVSYIIVTSLRRPWATPPPPPPIRLSRIPLPLFTLPTVPLCAAKEAADGNYIPRFGTFCASAGLGIGCYVHYCTHPASAARRALSLPEQPQLLMPPPGLQE